jgi:hypothetical protein
MPLLHVQGSRKLTSAGDDSGLSIELDASCNRPNGHEGLAVEKVEREFDHCVFAVLN